MHPPTQYMQARIWLDSAPWQAPPAHPAMRRCVLCEQQKKQVRHPGSNPELLLPRPGKRPRPTTLNDTLQPALHAHWHRQATHHDRGPLMRYTMITVNPCKTLCTCQVWRIWLVHTGEGFVINRGQE
jgi:hypothetical protein